MTDTTKPTLALFESFQIARMTPKQKSDFAAHLLETGFDKAEVVAVFGPRDLKLTPTEAEIKRRERAAYLRENWKGDKAALEDALNKTGLAQ